MEEITIRQATTYSPEISAAVHGLVVQLDKNYKELTDDDVRFMIDSSCNHLLLAYVGEKIVGMVTLIIYRIPYVRKGIIEDVVVDKDFRQRGIGKKLIRAALERAKEEQASYVDLTSNPMRDVANKMYAELGFKQRETNIYRYSF